MPLRDLFICGLLACALTLSHGVLANASEGQIGPKVLAFYYTWYGTPDLQGRWVHWDEGGKSPSRTDSKGWPEIGATHHPLRLYDSNDPEIIREHLKAAADSHIDAFICTWWKQGDYHDKALANVIREAEKSSVKVTVYYETVPSVAAAAEKGALTDAVVDDFRYILDSYADSPAFLKVDGKPVIFVYGRALGQMDRNSWAEAVRRIKELRPVILIGDSTSADWLTVFDGLHVYNPVGSVVAEVDMLQYYQRLVHTCTTAGKIATATVLPGYDDSNIGRLTPTICDRQGGALYRRLWAYAIRSNPDWVIITSFNEWHEGSEIEPSKELGNLYMDITARYASVFAEGSDRQLADSAIPWGPGVSSPENLIHSVTATTGGGWLLGNLDDRPGTIRIPRKPWERLIVFELGKEGRHLRRVYPEVKGKSLSLPVSPLSDYELYEADDFADSVLKDVCEIDPSGLTGRQKLDGLASKLDSATPCQMRLISEAYQALLGLDFKCEMSYRAANPAADYRVFTGREFAVKCTVTNRGTEALDPATVKLIVPDEWTVSPGSGKSLPPDTLAPGRSASARFKIRAPGRSTFRPALFPLIAELVSGRAGRLFTLHYPCGVELADPFTPTLTILSADPTCFKAAITLQSLFPGLNMNNVSAYPFIPRNIKVEPARQRFDFKCTKTFRISYLKDGPPESSLRSVTMVMKADDHLVRLRSVMEAALHLGTSTRSRGLWMNQHEDGLTDAAVVADKECRQTVQNRFGDTRHVYFAISPNFPTVGNSYVTVTYFDGPAGAFTVQYDSADAGAPLDGAYKEAPDTVRLEGTGKWKQKTFVLPDAAFLNRQNSKSDFRLAAIGADLAIAEIAVSKFPPAGTQQD